jgi:hypothetical protein
MVAGFVTCMSRELRYDAASQYLDGFLEGETISQDNAWHIALGIVAASHSEALVMDGGGHSIDTIADQLFEKYGPKSR